jgi:hypothetical protein
MPLVNDPFPRVRPDTGSDEDRGVGERSLHAWVWILGFVGLLLLTSLVVAVGIALGILG